MANLGFDASAVTPHPGRPDAMQDQPRDTAKVWSKYQHNFLEWVDHGTGNAVLEAVAGAGKSTIIEEATKRVRGSYIVLAFGKAIAESMKARGVNGRTFHSLTYMPALQFKKANKPDMNKMRRLVDATLTGDDAALYGSFIIRMVDLAKGLGVGCLLPDTEATWTDIMTFNDIEIDREGADYSKALRLCSTMLAASDASPLVDFNDMLYWSVKEGLTLPKFDFVFVDEAQDTNPIQRAILRKLMKSNTRIVFVGDPAQSIYGFRGATVNAMDLMAEEFSCVKLPLSITHRCPKSVVTYAQTWVPHLEAAPGAPEGDVLDYGTEWNLSVFQADDLVVCRTTKPLISLAYKLLKAHIPVRIMGKEIGEGLVKLINKMNARDIATLESKLQVWTEREVEKATAKMQDSKAVNIQDKTDAILTLIDGLDEDERTIPALMRVIAKLFAEGVGMVVCSTIHKAKGLEAERVMWLNRSQCPSRWARQDWQKQQEEHLCYVAATRAKKTLVIFEEKTEK